MCYIDGLIREMVKEIRSPISTKNKTDRFIAKISKHKQKLDWSNCHHMTTSCGL
jgi:hypothetical protein